MKLNLDSVIKLKKERNKEEIPVTLGPPIITDSQSELLGCMLHLDTTVLYLRMKNKTLIQL